MKQACGPYRMDMFFFPELTLYLSLSLRYPYLKMHRGDCLDDLPQQFRKLALQVAPPHRDMHLGKKHVVTYQGGLKKEEAEAKLAS